MFLILLSSLMFLYTIIQRPKILRKPTDWQTNKLFITSTIKSQFLRHFFINISSFPLDRLMCALQPYQKSFQPCWREAMDVCSQSVILAQVKTLFTIELFSIKSQFQCKLHARLVNIYQRINFRSFHKLYSALQFNQ